MDDFSAVSTVKFSDTIGAIYDCALDPERWHDTIRMITNLCESPMGSICVHKVNNRHEDHMFACGYAGEFWEKFEKYIHLNPVTAAFPLMNVGDVLSIATIVSDDEMRESRFYREVLEPFGYLDFIGLSALRTGGRVAYLQATRTERDPRYGAREINLFKLLSPHVCRALAIADVLDLRTLRSEMLEATLDGLVAGVYLATHDGRVVYMNAAAERQVKTGNAIRIVNNRLSPTDPEARAVLSKAIDDAGKDEANARLGGHTLAIPENRGAGYVATLLPLERGRRKSIIAPFAASVAIFTRDPTQAPLLPGEAFARLYGLTGGELRVLLALAQGLGAKEAADMLGISEPTVRTHLQHMFSKTGTSRQADLLRRMHSSAPPVMPS